MKLTIKYIAIILIGGSLTLSSCSKAPDSPGYEYVPDMYRSQAIEAYVDYGMVGDEERDETADRLRNTQSARVPADGTIPYKANANVDKESAILYMPYPYTIGQKAEAAEKLKLPKVFLDDIEGNLKEGKRLYNIFCQHCHGLTGEGDGGVVVVGGFNPPPAYNTAYKERTMGSVYHTITHGTGGAMGSHASQINKVDRWKIVMYVNSLQHGEFIGDVEVVNDTTKSENSTEGEEEASTGQAIFGSLGCVACHQVDTKTVGPALKDIATAYAGNTEALTVFFKGEGEAIVDPAMFAVMQGQLAITSGLSDSDLSELVNYINSIK